MSDGFFEITRITVFIGKATVFFFVCLTTGIMLPVINTPFETPGTPSAR